MYRRSRFQRHGRTTLLLAALALAGCPFAYNANLGAEVKLVLPDGRSCARGGDGAKLVICSAGVETNDYEYNVRVVAKGLGEDLEATTDIQGDAGGPATGDGDVYQTFIVTSDTLLVGEPVDLVIRASLFGQFFESPRAGLSRVSYFAEYWTDGCDASGCGGPTNPTTVANFEVLSSLVTFFSPAVEEPLAGLVVGDVFGVRASLHVETESPSAGGRARADAFGDFDIRDPADEPEAGVLRLDFL